MTLGLTLNYAIFLYQFNNMKKEGLRKLTHIVTEALDDFEKWDDDEMEEIKK